MKTKVWREKALSLCLIVATIATYSMVILAGAEKVTGELLVSGINANGVTVNGAQAQSGRTLFSASSVATGENAIAEINLGQLGSLRLAEKSTMLLSFSEAGISGELVEGSVLVLNSKNVVNIKTAEGEIFKLKSGESATTKNSKAQDDDDSGSGSWFVWALLMGGAAAGLIYAATKGQDLKLGGGATVVSPSR